MIDGAAVRRARSVKGWSQDRLAEEAGVARQLIGQIERGENTTSKFIFRIARALDRPAHEFDPELRNVATLDRVPLVGYLDSASHLVTFFSPEAEMPGTARFSLPPPQGGSPVTRSIEIRNDGLGPFLKGWLAYYEDEELPPAEIDMRQLCVVRLTNGETYLNRLMRGSAPGRFHLVSLTGGIVEDVEVVWAARVTALVSPLPSR